MSNGVANFEGCNIHDNTADYVCLHVELFLNFHPSPRWNVTCAHGWQYGGGLYILGTATLTNTNVYANQAAVAEVFYITGDESSSVGLRFKFDSIL